MTFAEKIGICPLMRSPMPCADALVRHMHDVEPAGELLEQFARHVGGRAVAGKAVGQFAGIGLGVGDQLLERMRGHLTD